MSRRKSNSISMEALYPRSTPAPARFRRAHVIEPANDNAAYVVYEWDVADALGGVVGLAYPIDDGASDYPLEHIGAIAAELRSYRALAITSAEHLDGIPSLWVVDGRDESMIAEPNSLGALNLSWATLAELLRTDIPWWPTALRHESAMLAWRPGAPRQRITPYTRGLDPRVFLRAIDPDTPHLVVDALQLLYHNANHSLIDRQPYPDTRGFTVAAEPDVSAKSPLERMPREWLSALLHHQMPDERTARRITATLTTYPLVSGMITVPADETDPLARQWADRLVWCSPIELGHHVIVRRVDSDTITEFLRDPCCPDCWAVRDAHGITYGTVGSVMPANGPLRRATMLGNRSAFFEDSGTGEASRRAWPMPIDSGRAYNAGYPGEGPRTLVRAVATLARNGRFDLAGHHTLDQVDDGARLWMRVSTESPPVTISEQEVAELVGS